MEIRIIFKDKTREEGVGVTDLIYRIVQVLGEDLEKLAKLIQERIKKYYN